MSRDPILLKINIGNEHTCQILEMLENITPICTSMTFDHLVPAPWVPRCYSIYTLYFFQLFTKCELNCPISTQLTFDSAQFLVGSLIYIKIRYVKIFVCYTFDFGLMYLFAIGQAVQEISFEQLASGWWKYQFDKVPVST